MIGTLHKVVTFARNPTSGNPANVLVLNNIEEGADLTNLCCDLNLDMLATCCWLDISAPPQIDFFTKKGRHGGAGHATLAIAHTLLSTDGRLSLRKKDNSLQQVRRNGALLSVQWPLMEYHAIDRVEAIADAVGQRPVETFTSSFGWIAIYENENTIAHLNPNISKISGLDCNALIVTSLGKISDISLRVFAPRLGLPEDPVCGTAHRIIVPYWHGKLRKKKLESRQLSPRGGTLFCRLEQGTIWISGEAMTVSSEALR